MIALALTVPYWVAVFAFVLGACVGLVAMAVVAIARDGDQDPNGPPEE